MSINSLTTRQLFPNQFDLKCPISLLDLTQEGSSNEWGFLSCSHGEIRTRIWDYAHASLQNKNITSHWLDADGKIRFRELFWSYVQDPKWGMPSPQAFDLEKSLGPDGPEGSRLLKDGKFSFEGLHAGEKAALAQALASNSKCSVCSQETDQKIYTSLAFNACFYRPEPDPSLMERLRGRIDAFQYQFNQVTAPAFKKFGEDLRSGTCSQVEESYYRCADIVKSYIKSPLALISSIYMTVMIWQTILGTAQAYGYQLPDSYVSVLNQLERLMRKKAFPPFLILMCALNINRWILTELLFALTPIKWKQSVARFMHGSIVVAMIVLYAAPFILGRRLPNQEEWAELRNGLFGLLFQIGIIIGIGL